MGTWFQLRIYQSFALSLLEQINFNQWFLILDPRMAFSSTGLENYVVQDLKLTWRFLGESIGRLREKTSKKVCFRWTWESLQDLTEVEF